MTKILKLLFDFLTIKQRYPLRQKFQYYLEYIFLPKWLMEIAEKSIFPFQLSKIKNIRFQSRKQNCICISHPSSQHNKAITIVTAYYLSTGRVFPFFLVTYFPLGPNGLTHCKAM